MIERFNQLAQRSATGVSRRRFLGRLGRGAMAAAGALGGVIAFATDAVGAPTVVCVYQCTREDDSTYIVFRSGPCRKKNIRNDGHPCVFIRQFYPR
jgi:hypothetical protein